ncbi:MAG: hypothetical protein Q9226_004130 [Calogaya cf. arnoldii]
MRHLVLPALVGVIELATVHGFTPPHNTVLSISLEPQLEKLTPSCLDSHPWLSDLKVYVERFGCLKLRNKGCVRSEPGALQQELAKGFCVSDEELAEAQQALFPADDRGWSQLPLEMTPCFYKEKTFQWSGVQSWVGLRECELPLRMCGITGGRPLFQTISGSASAGKVKGHGHELTTDLSKDKASGNEDELMEDVAVGAEEDEHDRPKNSSKFKESSNEHDKFGDPFPAPEDYPWALGW